MLQHIAETWGLVVVMDATVAAQVHELLAEPTIDAALRGQFLQ